MASIVSRLGRQNIFRLFSTSVSPAEYPSIDTSISLYPKLSQAPIKEARLIKLRYVRNMSRNGKVPSYSAAVVVGNGEGGIGYGLSKDKRPNEAIVKATKEAEKNMEYFELYENRTMFHEIQAKFKASILLIRPMPPEIGRRTHWAIQEMCRCIGIQDLSAKVRGSRNPLNVAHAFLIALRNQKTPRQIALDSGMRIEDVLVVFNHGKKKIEKEIYGDLTREDLFITNQ